MAVQLFGPQKTVWSKYLSKCICARAEGALYIVCTSRWGLFLILMFCESSDIAEIHGHRMRWTSSLSVSYPTRMRMCWPGLWTTQKRDGLHFGESLSLAGTNPYWCCIFSMFGKCMSITENDHSYSVLHFCLFLVNFICLAYLFLLLVGSQNIVTPITENKTLSFL